MFESQLYHIHHHNKDIYIVTLGQDLQIYLSVGYDVLSKNASFPLARPINPYMLSFSMLRSYLGARRMLNIFSLRIFSLRTLAFGMRPWFGVVNTL